MSVTPETTIRLDHRFASEQPELAIPWRAEAAPDPQDDDLRSLERQAAAEQQTVDPETGEVQRDEWLEGYEAAEAQQ